MTTATDVLKQPYCYFDLFKIQLSKILNGWHFKVFGALMATWVTHWLLGGITDDLEALFFLLLLDFAFGFGWALKKKCISKLALRRGAIKMLIYFSLVIAANLLDKSLYQLHILKAFDISTARTFVILYLCITEMVSILEKAERFGVAIPEGFLKALKKWLKTQDGTPRNK